jgi:hypothetical protein
MLSPAKTLAATTPHHAALHQKQGIVMRAKAVESDEAPRRAESLPPYPTPSSSLQVEACSSSGTPYARSMLAGQYRNVKSADTRISLAGNARSDQL